MARRFAGWVPVFCLVVAAASGVGCRSSRGSGEAESPCSHVEEDVNTSVRTGASGAKTGAKTGVEGVKTFGRATAGLFEGGSDEARRRWKEGSETTKRTARDSAAETRHEAGTRRCR